MSATTTTDETLAGLKTLEGQLSEQFKEMMTEALAKEEKLKNIRGAIAALEGRSGSRSRLRSHDRSRSRSRDRSPGRGSRRHGRSRSRCVELDRIPGESDADYEADCWDHVQSIRFDREARAHQEFRRKLQGSTNKRKACYGDSSDDESLPPPKPAPKSKGKPKSAPKSPSGGL